jgi:hypothetical protein
VGAEDVNWAKIISSYGPEFSYSFIIDSFLFPKIYAPYFLIKVGNQIIHNYSNECSYKPCSN